MTPKPSHIKLHKKARELEFEYEHRDNASVSCELLRVCSPSAEVRGHSSDQRQLQTGKKYVNISALEFVGNYAVRISFDDGHDTGIYSWEYLEDLIDRSDDYWNDYLKDLKAANASRLPTIPLGHWSPD